MASVKVKFRPSTIEGKEGTVYYQIIQNRVIRQLKTDYRIFTNEWNEAGSCIIVGSSERSNLLLSLQERMEWDLKRMDMIIRSWITGKPDIRQMILSLLFKAIQRDSRFSTLCRVS